MSDRKERIFILIEPGERALSTRKLILEAAGYNCLSAMSIQQGSKFFSDERHIAGVIIDTDVHDLPLGEAIDRFAARNSTPVFLLAPHPWPPDEARGRIAAVFQKMSDPAEMVKTIAEHYGDPPGPSGY